MKWNLSNGANVSTTPGEIRVIGPGFRFNWSTVLLAAFACWYAWVVWLAASSLMKAWSHLSGSDLLSPIIVLAVFTFGVSRTLLHIGETERFSCTATEFRHLRYRFGRLVETLTIAPQSITLAFYGVHGTSKGRSTMGLIVDTPQYTLKTLPDISATEADRLLSELERFGVNVLHDPALPMVAYMENNGWFVNPWAKS